VNTVLPQPASRQALAVLRSPDQRSTWIVILAASLEAPLPCIDARLRDVQAAVPLIAARLHDETWHAGPLPSATVMAGEPLESEALLARFDLSTEAPLRVFVGAGGRRIVLAGHHAAFDGRALAMLLGAILGGDLPPPAPPLTAPSMPARASGWRTARRLASPASRVAPSSNRPARDVFVVRPVQFSGSGVTARIAAACAAAAGARNRALGHPWRRVAISLGIGGSGGVGNVATYRRVELPATEPVAPAVDVALRSAPDPYELVTPPRLGRALSPLMGAFSDSFLVSNLGRVALPAVRSVEFYPVARGRSAVAVGAVGVSRGDASLSLRARDLSPDDAAELLDSVVRRLEA